MNQMGGGGVSNGVNIEYYKFKKGGTNQTEKGGEIIQMLILTCAGCYNFVHGEVSTTKHKINISPFMILSDRYELLDVGLIPGIKSVIEDLVINGGTLQERADQICELERVPKININDYLEPITEEEFYNIKPE